jgi:proteic killer suppression protein
VIKSFVGIETERIFRGLVSKKLPYTIQKTARRKLLYLHDGVDLQDLLAPPGNRLEKLHGTRDGQYNICVNDLWRICFKWHQGWAKEVELVDYHS